MNYRQFSLLKTFLAVFVAVSALSLIYLDGAKASQNSTRSSGKLLRKSASTNQVQANKSEATRTVSIRLDALQAVDVVNIRPKTDSQLEVTAGTIGKRFQPQAPTALINVEPGQPLPESSLSVEPNLVSFSRPPSLDDTVFLDIQIPARARVRLEVNGEVVLQACLLQPLSFRNREWGLGASNTSGVIMSAILPSDRQSSASPRPVYNPGSGTYFVPFSNLQPLERRPFSPQTGSRSVAILQINEAGHVIKVTPVTEAFPPGLEDALRRWRFAPYHIDGRPVRVSTMLVVTGQ